jgi:sugar lactone lactonase YvrE
VVRYDPDGKEERRIATPAKQTSCVTFGGADLSDLFITSAARSEAMPIMPPGYDPDAGFFGGPLYRTAAGVRGRAESKAKIVLG